MSISRNRLGPGTTLADENAGTRSGESILSESTVTSSGSNGTRSHTWYRPSESDAALPLPTNTRTPGTGGSPVSQRPLLFWSRNTRPAMPARSSDGPGEYARWPVARFHSSEPCTNCDAVAGAPGGAVTVVSVRTAGRKLDSTSVNVAPRTPRVPETPASMRTPDHSGRSAKTWPDVKPVPLCASTCARIHTGPSTRPNCGRGSTNASTPANDWVVATPPVGALRSSRT